MPIALPGCFKRGVRNAFRNRSRTAVAVPLLAVVVGTLAVMIQAAFSSRAQIATLETRVRTLVELREAGAFGTGGFGSDKPIGEERFGTGTLAAVTRTRRRRPSGGSSNRVTAPRSSHPRGWTGRRW